MHIRTTIYPDSFSIQPDEWERQVKETMDRIEEFILESTVHAKSAAFGSTTLLANDDSGMIVATIDIRRE